MVTAVSLACVALMKMGGEVAQVFGRVNWMLVALAVGGLAIYQYLNAGTWKDVYSCLSKDVSRGETVRIWIRSESMKWLPGGIWGYSSRVIASRRLGVDLPTASAALAAELSLTVMAWALTAVLILPTTIGNDLSERAIAFVAGSGDIAAFSVVVASLGFCLLIFTQRVRSVFSKVITRFLPSVKGLEIRPGALSRSVVSYLGLCVFNGTLLWLITLAVPGVSIPWSATVGVGGVAWLAGFFAIGVPGGIGVREAALAGLLAWYGNLESAAAAAVLFRAAQVVAELLALGGALLIDWKISRNALAGTNCLV